MPRKRDPELTRVCPECDKEFQTTRKRLAEATATGLSFCSNRCAGSFKARLGINKPPLKKAKPENTIELPCQWCGTMVRRLVSSIDKRSKQGPFCNHECYGLWRSENLTGENSPGWKGGYNYEYGGSHWKSQRRKARERDNNTCQDCGITEQAHGYKLDVHHLIPYDMFDDPEQANDLGNLITLCRPCHVKRHQDLDRATLEKLLAMEAD